MINIALINSAMIKPRPPMLDNNLSVGTSATFFKAEDIITRVVASPIVVAIIFVDDLMPLLSTILSKANINTANSAITAPSVLTAGSILSTGI